MLNAAEIAPLEPFRLRRPEYFRLWQMGAFADRRVQLVYGTVITMNAMGSRHAGVITILTRQLVKQVSDEYDVRVQVPFIASEDSEPEPDFCIVARPRQRSESHPSSAFLIIEISDASRKLDLEVKSRLYAECGVPEYWVVDLVKNVVVAHRTVRRGRYSSVRRFGPGKTIRTIGPESVVLETSDVLTTR